MFGDGRQAPVVVPVSDVPLHPDARTVDDHTALRGLYLSTSGGERPLAPRPVPDWAP